MGSLVVPRSTPTATKKKKRELEGEKQSVWEKTNFAQQQLSASANVLSRVLSFFYFSLSLYIYIGKQ